MLPHNSAGHPLHSKIQLAAWILSSEDSRVKAFQKGLPRSSSSHGRKVLTGSITDLGKNGLAGVINSRLQDTLTNPLTEVALLFHHVSIPLFNNFKKLLQCDEPVTDMLHGSTIQLARSLANRIIKRINQLQNWIWIIPRFISQSIQSLWGVPQSSGFKNFSIWRH